MEKIIYDKLKLKDKIENKQKFYKRNKNENKQSKE